MTNVKNKVEKLLHPIRRDMSFDHPRLYGGKNIVALYNQIGIITAMDGFSISVAPIGRTFE